MPIRKERVYGFWLQYDDDFIEGVRYLRTDLQYEEAKTLFDAARLTGHAFFEDDYDRDWTLLFNRGDGSYSLHKRDRE